MDHKLNIQEFLVAKEWAKNMKKIPRRQSVQVINDQKEEWDVTEHGRQFCSSTSLHGVQYFGEPNRHWVERLMTLNA